MSRTLIGLLVASFIVWIGAAAPTPAVARDEVINVPNEDAEMAAAIAKARASLPKFWKVREAAKAGEEGFALKVRIPYGKDFAEHFWLTNIMRDGDRMSGIISNDPNDATHVSKGDRYDFTEAEVSDWLYRRNGKMVGNETMRPLLKRMPKAQADQYRAMYESP